MGKKKALVAVISGASRGIGRGIARVLGEKGATVYVVGSRASLERMNRAFADWKLRPVIDRVYGFNEVVEGYKHLYRGAFGKIVVRVKD